MYDHAPLNDEENTGKTEMESEFRAEDNTSEAINARDVTVEVMSMFGKWDVDEQIENGQYLI